MVIQLTGDRNVEAATDQFLPLAIEAGLYPADELDLQRRVTNFLGSQSMPALRWLTVDVEGQCVSLHGRVRTFHEKQLAVHGCRRVAGVARVIDAIQVQPDLTSSQ